MHKVEQIQYPLQYQLTVKTYIILDVVIRKYK